MSEPPIDLDKHRGVAAQRATDIRRVIAEAKANAKQLRERQSAIEIELLSLLARCSGKGALGLELIRSESCANR